MESLRPLLSSPGSRVLMATSGVALVAAVIVGVSDNAPGITLAYVAATSGVAAFTTRWTSPRAFLRLAGLSVVGFVVCAVLHNGLDAVAGRWEATPLVAVPVGAASVAAFLVAVLIAPGALLVGVLGALATALRGGRPTRG